MQVRHAKLGKKIEKSNKKMESITLQPASKVGGTIKLPGSKSISNRTLLLAAFSNGVTEIRDLLKKDGNDKYKITNL